MATDQFTTRRTPDCHPERKHNARGLCNTCYSRWLRQNVPDYRLRQSQQSSELCSQRRDLYNANRRRKLRDISHTAEYKNAERWRKVKFRYGITESQFAKLVEAQGGECPICKRALGSGKSVHIDHDHLTGLVRGILCASCNSMLGKIERNTGMLRRAQSYLGIDQ